MARKVWLTITGIQKGFDQEEPVTLVTEGSYIHKNGVHYIFYSERTEEGAVIKNRLTISPGNVELRKTGAGNFNSVLVFDTEHNKNCLYQSPAGPMELVSDTKKIRVLHGDAHFKLQLKYSLIMNGMLVSDYDLTVLAKFMEQDGLETALQKAIFSRKEEQQYMPVLHENHIHKDTEFFMIQCYFPANKDIQADDKFDNTQFFYRFIRQCQQIFAEKKVLSVIFQRDLYITLVAKMPTGTERENVIQQIKTFSESFARQKELYMAVGDEETVVENLWEKYRDLSYLCRWGRQKGKNICQEEELGISRLWLSIGNIKKLEKYREKMLGELERLDQETGSEYIRILKCYLETNGNIGEVATECYLHRNTVSYHLKKIAEITGKTLNSTKDRSDWYMAYQIDEFLGLI